MAYSELIKNFERIRDYMNEFYIYGFKSRNEYHQKSPRSYDNERRRIESYVGEYMFFRQGNHGKNVFLSIDSRRVRHNPLYQALKARSFTSGDITLHFILLDILNTADEEKSLGSIMEIMDKEYLSHFHNPRIFDESTIRKKLKEYETLGIICSQRKGKQTIYRRGEDFDLSSWKDAICFFSEAGMDGVIGSYLLDKLEDIEDPFVFKHHYITHAMESEILCSLFQAMRNKRIVSFVSHSHRQKKNICVQAVPLRIFVSVQTGRRYLMGYDLSKKYIRAFRLDLISQVKAGGISADFDEYRKMLEKMQKHMWGVQGRRPEEKLQSVSFLVHFSDREEYIYQRLLREKRCGTVERLDRNTCRFSAKVYDVNEMLPWIRTFICRITDLHISQPSIEGRFRKDLEEMYQIYGIE